MSYDGSRFDSSPLGSVTSVIPGTVHGLSTAVCTVAELFDTSASGLVVVSDALFDIVPPKFACTLTTIVSRSPAGRFPRSQTRFVEAVHDPVVGVAESSDAPLGSVSVTFAPVTAFCPVVTPIVYVTSLRTRTRADDAFRLNCGSPPFGSAKAPTRVLQPNLPSPV